MASSSVAQEAVPQPAPPQPAANRAPQRPKVPQPTVKQPTPVVKEEVAPPAAPVEKPLRYTIPENASSQTLPHTMMQVPVPLFLGDAPAAKGEQAIFIKDSNGKEVENIAFGFRTSDNKTLRKDQGTAALKEKARVALSSLWFGKLPENVLINENDHLVVEGTPLKIFLVKLEGGEKIDFSEKEEPLVEKQLADQIRALLYQPSPRDLSLHEDHKVFFGVTRNGQNAADATELAWQEKIYKILHSEDVSTFATDEDGSLSEGRDRLIIYFYWVGPGGKVIAIDSEPERTKWYLGLRQQIKYSLIVGREREQIRLAAVNEARAAITSLDTVVRRGVAKDQTKQARIDELIKARTSLPGLLKSLNAKRRPDEALAEETLARTLAGRIEEEYDKVAYPLPLAIKGICAGYQINQLKRDKWVLSHASNTKAAVAEWAVAPLWQFCQGESLVVALPDGAPTAEGAVDAHWEAFQKGKLVISEKIDPQFAVTSAKFRKDTADISIIQLVVQQQPMVVIEFNPDSTPPTLRNRLLVDAKWDNRYRLWLAEGDRIQLAQIKDGKETVLGLIDGLDIKSLLGDGETFTFTAKSVVPKDGAPEARTAAKLFLAKPDGITDLTDKLPGVTIGKVEWMEGRNHFRLAIEGDTANYIELNPADITFARRLTVPGRCDRSYVFTVEEGQKVLIQLAKPLADASANIGRAHQLKGIDCQPGGLAVLAHHFEALGAEIKKTSDPAKGQLALEEFEKAQETPVLYVLKENNLVAYPPFKDFVFTELTATSSTEAVGYQATMKGPISLAVVVSGGGEWQEPKLSGKPLDGKGLLVGSNGAGVLMEKGQWLLATEKLASAWHQEGILSLVGDNLAFNTEKIDASLLTLKENRLSGEGVVVAIDKEKVVGSYVSPSANRGEPIESTQLIKVDGEWGQRLSVKGNEVYSLIVSLDGKTETADKKRPAPSSKVTWNP